MPMMIRRDNHRQHRCSVGPAVPAFQPASGHPTASRPGILVRNPVAIRTCRGTHHSPTTAPSRMREAEQIGQCDMGIFGRRTV